MAEETRPSGGLDQLPAAPRWVKLMGLALAVLVVVVVLAMLLIGGGHGPGRHGG